MPPRMRAFLAFMLAVTIAEAGLGVWQWRRMGEKRALIDAVARAAAAPPRAYGAGTPLWARVTLIGRFLHEHAAYVRTSRPATNPGARDAPGQVSPSGFGVLVMTPFVHRDCTPDGSSPACRLRTVYVNRGFLPTAPDGRIPAHEQPEEPMTIVGFVRPGERPGLFQPGNDPARKTWFLRSTEDMAVASGLFGAADTGAARQDYSRFIDRQAAPDEAAPPFGIRVADFLKSIPDNHFQYALTWWALAATNLAVLAIFFTGVRKRALPR